MSKIFFNLIILTILAIADSKSAHAAVEFTISNSQSDSSKVTVDVSLTGLTSSSCSDGKCYLQAAFRQGDYHHFGFTQDSSGGWYKYESDPGKDNIKSTFFSFEPTDGAWQGSLTAKVDPDASGYKGPGTYEVKVWRYSGNSDGPTGDASNSLTVDLSAEKPSDETEQTSSTSSTTSKSPTPTPKSSPKSSTKKSPSPTPKVLSASTSQQQTEATRQPMIEDSISQVDPNQFANPSSSPATQQPSKKFAGILIGSGAVLISASVIGYLYYRRQDGSPAIQKEKERFEPKDE